MACSSLHEPKPLGKTNGHNTVHGATATPDAVGSAYGPLVDPTDGQPRLGDANMQDPFAYYKAFFTSDIPTASHTNPPLAQGDDDNIGVIAPMGAHSAHTAEMSQHCRVRAVPQHLSVHPPNRSNGVPLATIIEQSSISTLNSHKSSRSVDWLPSIRAVDSVLAGSTWHPFSRSFGESTLSDIQEETPNVRPARRMSNPVSQGVYREGAGHLREHTAPTPCPPSQSHQSKAPLSPGDSHSDERTGLKRMFRGVVQSVRAISRTRSCSSSITDTLEFQEATGAPNGKTYNSQSLTDIQCSRTAQQKEATPGDSTAPSESIPTPSTPLHSPLGALTRSQTSLTNVSKRLATISSPPISNLSTITPNSFNAFQLPAGNEPESSPPVCHTALELHNKIQGHVRPPDTTWSRCRRDEPSAPSTLEAISVYRNDASSFCENERLRSNSRNPSFCSTQSTSYSGTVLGVDLDLQHDFSNPGNRPVTPVWFNRQENRKACDETLMRRQRQEEIEHLPAHFVPSYALSSLLPIAAAEGIVTPNFQTPQLSFFSPSGNLIQADESPTSTSSSDRSSSNYPRPPKTPTPHHNDFGTSEAHQYLSNFIVPPAARLASASAIASSSSTAPVPEHLGHHRCYQINRKSASISHEKLMVYSTPKIKGCGGVVRSESLNPRSGIVPPGNNMQDSRHGHSMSCLWNREESKTRFSALSPSSRVSRTPEKRLTNAPASVQILGKARPSCPSIGPLAGRTFSACFCQPYDGTSNHSTESICKSSPNQRRDEAVARQKGGTTTPNVRIIESLPGHNTNKGKSRTRRDSAVSVGVLV